MCRCHNLPFYISQAKVSAFVEAGGQPIKSTIENTINLSNIDFILNSKNKAVVDDLLTFDYEESEDIKVRQLNTDYRSDVMGNVGEFNTIFFNLQAYDRTLLTLS
jgi:diphthamide synthase (EF-2-diphthine--ammonia ligase)